MSSEGLPDYTKWHLATALLFYISSNCVCFSDGLNYVDDCADIELYKTVFKLIFQELKHERRYKIIIIEDE